MSQHEDPGRPIDRGTEADSPSPDPFRSPLAATITLNGVALACDGIATAALVGGGLRTDADAMTVGCVGLAGLAAMLVRVVFWCQLMHRWWSAIPRLERRTTPACAVGFCFIPLFNLYWVWVAYVGLASDLNSALAARGRSPTALRWLAGFYSASILISLVTRWIPVLNLVWGTLILGLFIGVASNLTRAARSLLLAEARPAEAAAPTPEESPNALDCGPPIAAISTCPNCGTRMIPTATNLCPACRRVLPATADERTP